MSIKAICSRMDVDKITKMCAILNIRKKMYEKTKEKLDAECKEDAFDSHILGRTN